MFLQELDRRNFLVDVSSIYALLKRNIPNKKLSLNFFRGLGWFFSIQFNCPIYRECYRRIRSCVFWLQLHYREIKDFLSQRSFKINTMIPNLRSQSKPIIIISENKNSQYFQ